MPEPAAHQKNVRTHAAAPRRFGANGHLLDRLAVLHRHRHLALALFTLKDSGISAIFVIFICSTWPMLINTAFGVASVRRDWLNVAKTLEVKPLRKAFTVILPAAAPRTWWVA